MNYLEPELKDALVKFENLLNEYSDNANNVIPYKSFIKYFLKVKTKNITLPTSEILAVIKHERPLIYYQLKRNSASDNTLYFLTHIDMNYESAQKKLLEIKNLIK